MVNYASPDLHISLKHWMKDLITYVMLASVTLVCIWHLTGEPDKLMKNI
jgi:hypothetical protein